MKVHLIFPFVFFLFPFNMCREMEEKNRVKKEGRRIMKRMTQAGELFEGHDMARVFMEGQGHYHRVSKRDLRFIRNAQPTKRFHDFKLHLSKGSKVKLSLTHASVITPSVPVYVQTIDGRRRRNQGVSDCYAHGNLRDSSGSGWAAISYCDGIFGFAKSLDYDYFFHPVGIHRSKRSAQNDDAVHVMWRRAVLMNNATNSSCPIRNEDGEHGQCKILRSNEQMPKGHQEPPPTKLVVEMAMFTDAQYWQLLTRLYPGREDDYLLVRLAAVQALYGNRQKVGFDVQIKVKYVEYWVTNPEGYTPGLNMRATLRNFCKYTTAEHLYDIHALNTRNFNKSEGTLGNAYLSQACGCWRCFSSLMVGINSFKVLAHELGHNLGLRHPWTSNCQGKKHDNGFMDSRTKIGLGFSPCMKHELSQFIATGKGSCLFEENDHSSSTDNLINFQDVLPGQSRSPNALCELIVGPGYRYLPLAEDSLGDSVCHLWACLNDNETSGEFGRVRNLKEAPLGFPCGDEQFCIKGNCLAWDESIVGMDFQKLRTLKIQKTSKWSQWSSMSNECSRSCGTGVRLRERECVIYDVNLNPYCSGPSVQAKLCNRQPCQSDPTQPNQNNQTTTTKTSKPVRQSDLTTTSSQALRQVRKDEVCSRFPGSWRVREKDEATFHGFHSKSCFLICSRDRLNLRAKDRLVAIMPDGSPCYESQRSKDDLTRSNISLHCVKGFCMEFSTCRNETQGEDDCGIVAETE